MKIVIAGAGEVGFHIASHLSTEKKDVVVIDTNPQALRRVSDHIDVQTVLGSGSSPVTLAEAGLREAEILLAVTNSDEINLVACLVADILSPATRKLARVRHADFDGYHHNFKSMAPHIDTVINPETEVVKTIEQLMQVPGAVEMGEFADGRVKFVGVNLDGDTPFDGIRLAELPAKIGKPVPLIAAVVRGEELIIPMGKDRLMAGDEIYFTCEESRLMDTLELFGKRFEPVKKVMIIGGGSIGYRLASILEDTPIYTKIVEKSQSRCEFLAERLNRAVVLNGDGSDQELLREESIRDMDTVVALTDDEETNILASLLAKRMGARKAITKISRFSYFPLLAAIGIEKVVSPRLSAINSILKHIRRGKVLSAISIKGEQAEVIEAVALETSDIVGVPLMNIAFPRGVLVTAIVRENTVVIPSGGSIVEPGDRIVIFAKKGAVAELEKILAVKLEYF